MMPKHHVVLGAGFALLICLIFPKVPQYDYLLVFLASFLIDFDHYIIAALKLKSFNLKKAYNYNLLQGKKLLEARKKGKREKGDLFIFHTVEFMAIVLILGLYWNPFLYVLLGMIFHVILDIIYLEKKEMLYTREFSFIHWAFNKRKKKF